MSDQTTQHLTFTTPDEIRSFANGRLVLEPGWRWSNDVKRLAGTDLCDFGASEYAK